MGRSESGKTTLKQALSGEKINYYKTQYIHNEDVLIDTPGEYAQTHHLGYALALYSYEADVVGLLVAATESYTVFPLSALYYQYGESGSDWNRHQDQ